MRTSYLPIFLLYCSWAYCSNTVLHYEPAVVELKGTIEQQTFPGPPDYENIANGDKIEKGWYLKLSQPVDIIATIDDAPSANSETERNVKIMQLTWSESPELKKSVKNATNLKKEVRLKGYLFHRW